MHPVTVRYDVQRARESGLRAAWVHSRYGVPVRTQQRILHEALESSMSDTEFRRQRGVGRPPATFTPAHRQLLLAWAREDPSLPSIEGVRRLTSLHGYRGGKTVVYDFLKTHRPPRPPAPPVVRFEGLPGEYGQHDFGELWVTYTDGSQERIHFYCGRLKFSRVVHVQVIDRESTEAMIRGLEGLAAIAGGLPLQNVVDNTKAAVVKRTRDPETREEKIELQQQFASFLRAANVHADPAAPYSGNQKGCVENLVGFVKASFFTVRQFRNRADLDEQLREWERWVNAERKCDATGEIPFRRLERERDRLRPLPSGDYGLPASAVGNREGVVRFGGNRYSIPEAWIGQTVTVHLHRETVRLSCAGATVEHPRLEGRGQESLLTEHWTARFVKPRGEVMAKREILIQLGGNVVEEFFTELVQRRPHSWQKQDLPELWKLFEQHGAAAFVAATRTCVAKATIGAEYARVYLATAPRQELPRGIVLQRRPLPGTAAGSISGGAGVSGGAG